MGAAVSGLLLCLLVLVTKLRASYQIYSATMSIFLLCTAILHSLPRYLSVISVLHRHCSREPSRGGLLHLRARR